MSCQLGLQLHCSSDMPVLWDVEALKMVGCREFLLDCCEWLKCGRQTRQQTLNFDTFPLSFVEVEILS